MLCIGDLAEQVGFLLQQRNEFIVQYMARLKVAFRRILLNERLETGTNRILLLNTLLNGLYKTFLNVADFLEFLKQCFVLGQFLLCFRQICVELGRVGFLQSHLQPAGFAAQIAADFPNPFGIWKRCVHEHLNAVIERFHTGKAGNSDAQCQTDDNGKADEQFVLHFQVFHFHSCCIPLYVIYF